MTTDTISSNLAMQECIADCLHCYQTCLQTAMSHCLQVGGRHVEPEHFRLMTGCAEICRSAAHFMLSRTPMYAQVCAACAEVCSACGDSCEQIGDMDDCVQACRRCEQSCRRMSSGQPGIGTAGTVGVLCTDGQLAM